MTDTPTKQETESKTDNISGTNPSDQKKNNRNNDRKKNRRGDSMADMYKSQERPLDIDSYSHIPSRY